MTAVALLFAISALVVSVVFALDTRRHRSRAERHAAESAALLAERADKARHVELAEATADAQLLRGLAMRCYPTGDVDDVVELGPIHYLPAEDGAGHHWYIHVLVPSDVSDQLAQVGIWEQTFRPTATLLNFLLPDALSGSAAAFCPTGGAS